MQRILSTARARFRRYAAAIISRAKRPAIRRYLKTLAETAGLEAYPNVLVVFETFNKSHLLNDILRPFLFNGFRAIVLFADGCADDTLKKAADLLLGTNHFVVNSNNIHEVMANSMAAQIADQLGVEFLLLCQDDDLYPTDMSWLDTALSLMSTNEKIALISGNGGYNFVGAIKDADAGYSTATYQGFQRGGRHVAVLQPYYEMEMINLDRVIGRFSYSYASIVNRAPLLVRKTF